MAAAVSGRPQRHPHCGWIELLPLVSQHVRSPPGQPEASALGEQIPRDGEVAGGVGGDRHCARRHRSSVASEAAALG